MEYYVDTLIDEFGGHQVHNVRCLHLPKVRQRLFLGDFAHSTSALCVAQQYFFPNAKACLHCCHMEERAGVRE